MNHLVAGYWVLLFFFVVCCISAVAGFVLVAIGNYPRVVSNDRWEDTIRLFFRVVYIVVLGYILWG